jgi:hypothetical protein
MGHNLSCCNKRRMVRGWVTKPDQITVQLKKNRMVSCSWEAKNHSSQKPESANQSHSHLDGRHRVID